MWVISWWSIVIDSYGRSYKSGNDNWRCLRTRLGYSGLQALVHCEIVLAEYHCEETKVLEICEICSVYLPGSQLLSGQGCDLYMMQSNMGQGSFVTKNWNSNKPKTSHRCIFGRQRCACWFDPLDQEKVDLSTLPHLFSISCDMGKERNRVQRVWWLRRCCLWCEINWQSCVTWELQPVACRFNDWGDRSDCLGKNVAGVLKPWGSSQQPEEGS